MLCPASPWEILYVSRRLIEYIQIYIIKIYGLTGFDLRQAHSLLRGQEGEVDPWPMHVKVTRPFSFCESLPSGIGTGRLQVQLFPLLVDRSIPLSSPLLSICSAREKRKKEKSERKRQRKKKRKRGKTVFGGMT